MGQTPPTLTTERLRLRPHRRGDFPEMCALWQHPETIRFIGGQAQSDQAIWFRLLRYAGFWTILGYGFWAIEDRESGAYLGDAGLMAAERGLPGLAGLPEAGWALRPEAAGRGLATEAMCAILDWADRHVDAPQTACIIDPDNAPSLRVAHKLGYREADVPELDGRPIILLRRERTVS